MFILIEKSVCYSGCMHTFSERLGGGGGGRVDDPRPIQFMNEAFILPYRTKNVKLKIHFKILLLQNHDS